jgi:hypothetical protein
MKFSSEKPAIYEKCREKFGVDWDRGIVITYGEVIHSKNPISEDLKIHEETHIKQQSEIGTEKWWEMYFENKNFRLSQETEAYQNQVKFIRKNIKDKS